MTWATELFGDSLLVKKDGAVVTAPTDEVVGNKKFVIVYFSASWCGPCRKFTPLLSVCYEDRTDVNESQVVFVSADQDLEGFDSYFEEMPWSAVPFDKDDKRDEISGKFNVAGIPRVVVLNGTDGSIVNDDARGKIVEKKSISGVF